VGNGRAHIEVRGLDGPHRDDVMRRLATRLREHPHVSEVAALHALARIVVTLATDEADLESIIDVVEDVEAEVGVHDQTFATADHPGDVEVLTRQLLAAGADVAALGYGVTSRLLRVPALPAEPVLLFNLVDTVPRVRGLLERGIGTGPADLVLALGSATAAGLSQGPVGLLVDLAQRAASVAETTARARTWSLREPELVARASEPSAPPSARPEPAPPGPVERAADHTMAAAVGLSAVTLVLTSDPRRAAGVLAAGIPRAARVGREAFATRLGRSLSERGAVTLDAESLRRLDRVDTVVLDSALLAAGRRRVTAVFPTDGDDVDELFARATDLFAGGARDDGWALQPLTGQRWLGREQAAQVTALRRSGSRVLAISEGERLAGVAVVEPELDPLAEALVEAGRGVGEVVVAGRSGGVAARVRADRVLAGGARLARTVADLQRDGRTVALVTSSGSAALRAADVGVAVLREDRQVPWDADVLCGPGLRDGCLLLEAMVTARSVSDRSARLAAYGALTAGVLVFAGPSRTAVRRALLAVNAASIATYAVGAWSARELLAQPEPLPVDRTPWHALGTEAALRELASTSEGLEAAEAARRKAAAPAGAQTETGFARASLEELANPLTPPLATGAGVSAVVGSMTDAVLIGSVMGANAAMSAAQRVGADRAVRRLVDASAVRVPLRRRGVAETLARAEELVPGDVISLQAGDAVPADCRLLEAHGVEVDESSLTGESVPVPKTARPSMAAEVADRHSMVYEGTVVASGRLRGLVVAVGAGTEVGRSAHGARGARRGGVEERLDALTQVTIPVSLAASAALIVAGALHHRPLSTAIADGVGLAVAAVPEGLPLVATVAQLAAARRLSGRGALVRVPGTVEALGRVDTLCFDKTGTLTEGRIRLAEISDGETAVSAAVPLGPAHRAVLAAGLRACPDTRDPKKIAHPTDAAVIAGAAASDVHRRTNTPGWALFAELPFEPTRGYHAAVGRREAGPQPAQLEVKGAPEVVLPRCSTWRRPAGRQPIDGPTRRRLERAADDMARRGLRVLAVAERPASDRSDLEDARVARLELLGLLGLADPVRPAAAGAVRSLRDAGVDVVMLTGDHPSTAESIAAELGLLEERPVLLGADIDRMDDAALAEAVRDVTVFARVSPTHKVRVVRALRQAGRVVAVTGDGANDAPAIRLADVGVALGLHGTTAAKEAADLVVTDDRLETITDAIVEGRAVWVSVRDAIAVLVGGNLGEIVFTLGTGVLTPGGSALNARQLLLVNLLTDMIPAIALAIRPPRSRDTKSLLHEGPEASLGQAMVRDICVRGAATAAAAGGAWAVARPGGTRARAGTVSLVALVGAQLGQTAVAGWRSPLVLTSAAVSAGVLAAVVQTPGLSHFFGCRPLGPVGWTIGGGASVAATAAAAVAPRLLRLDVTGVGANEEAGT
jgi:cation-transporting ATPase I